MNDLFDPAFKGRIGMLTEMRDTVGLMLLGEGIDPSTIKTFKEVAAGVRQAGPGQERRQYPGLHRQRLPGRPVAGELRGVRRLVR